MDAVVIVTCLLNLSTLTTIYLHKKYALELALIITNSYFAYNMYILLKHSLMVHNILGYKIANINVISSIILIVMLTRIFLEKDRD